MMKIREGLTESLGFSGLVAEAMPSVTRLSD
jgi:hypothetical protein